MIMMMMMMMVFTADVASDWQAVLYDRTDTVSR